MALKSRLGLTLIETVVACFLLLCSFLVILNLFQSALGYTARTENTQLAAMLAERQFEQMRTWSETANGNLYNYDNPGLAVTYNGQTVTPGDFGSFNLTINVTNQLLYSPCSTFEQTIPIAPPLITRRFLPASASKVQIAVNWYDRGSRQLLVGTLFSRPALQWAAAACVTVPEIPPDPLNQGATTNFTATGIDSSGAAVNDVFFVWQIAPVNGTGTLTQARDGTVAELTNLVYTPPYLPTDVPPNLGVKAYTGGQCYVQAAARYHGKTVVVNSTAPVNLK